MQQTPTWLILFHQHGHTQHLVCYTEEAFDDELLQLRTTETTHICCITPERRYPWFNVYMVNEEPETV